MSILLLIIAILILVIVFVALNVFALMIIPSEVGLLGVFFIGCEIVAAVIWAGYYVAHFHT